jgi:hypothetical protein
MLKGDSGDPGGLSLSVSLNIGEDEAQKKCIGGKVGILPRRTNVWIEDDSVDECYKCKAQFSYFFRRHHCRGCGRIFCYECSKYQINASTLTKSNLIDPDKYLTDCLNQSTKFIPFRSCLECQSNFQKIRDLSSMITMIELLPIDISEYAGLHCINRMWDEACNVIMSRFREIQYHLPNHIFTPFEKRILKNSAHLVVGHNILMSQLIKSLDWGSLSDSDLEYHLALIQSTERTCNCKNLMCGPNCQNQFTDSEVIDILLHVNHPRVREIMLKSMSSDLILLGAYIPILTYVIRFDEETYRKKHKYYDVREHLINLSLISQTIRYQFFWEVIVQLEEPHFNSIYRETLEIFLTAIEMKLGIDALNDLKNGMKLINTFSQISVNASNPDEVLIDKLIANNIYEKEIPIPIKPDLMMCGIDYKKVKIMKSATCPVFIPCQVQHNGRILPSPLATSTSSPPIGTPVGAPGSLPPRARSQSMKATEINQDYASYSFIYKSEDIRKDRIISGIITIMDYILKKNGYDMNVVTYNVLPTAMSSGLIEIVPNAETLYFIKEKRNYSIQNHILENNSHEPIDEVRNRFIRSTAVYCIMTYLLGIGDRHLDNIMVTKDGRLFHIDYSFIMGFDPKPMAPKMRITSEMIDALGGANSSSYKQFEELCTQCYNILRKHANLFTNLLFLLTRIDYNKFTVEQLEIEIGKRFLPGEYRSQAKIQLLKTINSSHTASTITDFIHYHCKENLTFTKMNLYEKASGLMSYISLNPFAKKNSGSGSSGSSQSSRIHKTISSPVTSGAKVALPVYQKQ